MPKLQLIEEPWWGRESRISLVTEGVIHATAEDVFDVLADHRQWPSWYPGMITMELTGRTSGVGVERQVRIGRVRTEQRFTVWETNRRMTYCHVRSTIAGLAAAVEDWELIDDPDGTLVKYVVGAEPRVAARALTPAFRRRLRSTSEGAIDALRGQVELILAEGPIGSVALLAGEPIGGVAIDAPSVPLSEGFLSGPAGTDVAAELTADEPPVDAAAAETAPVDALGVLSEPAAPPSAIFTDDAFAPVGDSAEVTSDSPDGDDSVLDAQDASEPDESDTADTENAPTDEVADGGDDDDKPPRRTSAAKRSKKQSKPIAL